MPGTIFDSTLTGAGSSVMAGSRVYFVAWAVTVSGPNVRHPNAWDTDELVGVGHYSLGNDLTPGGVLVGIGFGAARWLNSLLGQHVVSPTIDPAGLTADLAQYIRWGISPGTEVHLYVLGDA